MATEIVCTLREIDGNSGQVKASYVLSKDKKSTVDENFRLDNTTGQITGDKPQGQNTQQYISTIHLNRIIQYLNTLFLPIGYPQSVSPDYTWYQIYDSVQAFASSIAGLLSSRAVLQSLDVISSPSSGKSDSIAATSTSAATAATLLSVLQSTLSNVTSILFASHAAPRISTEVKFYRFLADVVNDAAFVLDLLAPVMAANTNLPSALSFLPLSPRALVLCTSSMLRAICGVAGGSSKAVLSAHFARNNPESVGDLNAKDGSQETVINLVGMWVGGFVVSRVEGNAATWCWMTALLFLHLWANYQAVRSVTLRNLNRERAALVCHALLADQDNSTAAIETSVETIRSRESVLDTISFCRSIFKRLRGTSDGSHAWKRWRIGTSLQEFLSTLNLQSGGSAARKVSAYTIEIINLFESEAYLLHWNHSSCEALVILKVSARPIDQFKAWLHAAHIHRRIMNGGMDVSLDGGPSARIQLLKDTLSEVKLCWTQYCSKLESQGWDLDATNLELGTSFRLSIDTKEWL